MLADRFILLGNPIYILVSYRNVYECQILALPSRDSGRSFSTISALEGGEDGIIMSSEICIIKNNIQIKEHLLTFNLFFFGIRRGRGLFFCLFRAFTFVDDDFLLAERLRQVKINNIYVFKRYMPTYLVCHSSFLKSLHLACCSPSSGNQQLICCCPPSRNLHLCSYHSPFAVFPPVFPSSFPQSSPLFPRCCH